MTTRNENITEFVAWAGGFWNSDATTHMEAVQRLADQAVSFAGIADTATNRIAYARSIVAMVEARTLTIVKLDTERLAFEA